MDTRNKLVAIVIPVYKESLLSWERISFLQCVKILSKYPIFIAKPKSLNPLVYLKEYQELKIVEYDDRFFQSTSSYSQLLISPRFYSKFKEFNYLLIHQLDAFVFKDELEKWCNEKIDYVGAPWINESWLGSFRNSLRTSRYPMVKFFKQKIDFDSRMGNQIVGNGGFSLRRVSVFFYTSILLHFLKFFIDKEWNEDVVWSLFVKKYFPGFKIASFSSSVGFSIENNPEECLKLNQGVLPFGIHAWDKNMDYWKNYIRDYGYTL